MIIKRGKKYGVRVWLPDPSDPSGRRREWLGTYDTRAEAREAEAKAILHAGKRGRPVWTIEEFSVRWLKSYHGPNTKRPEDTTLVYNRDAIKAFVKEYGSRKLRDYDQADARDFAGEFPWRARSVKAMFADAVRDGKLAHNPFDGISIEAGHGRKHIHPLTMGEIDRLAEIAESALGFYGSHFAAFIRTHGWTGMRPGEVCRIEWSDFDWGRGRLEIPKSKTKYPRFIRLAPQALEVFRSIPRLDDFVFQTPRGKRMKPYSYRYYWTQVRAVFEAEQAGDHWLRRRLRDDPSDHLDIYECRHATVSMLIHEGLTIDQVAKYVGNSPQVCRETYVHLYEDRYEADLLAAFNRIGQNFGSASGAQTGRNALEGSA